LITFLFFVTGVDVSTTEVIVFVTRGDEVDTLGIGGDEVDTMGTYTTFP
jgi:hypothetical protein